VYFIDSLMNFNNYSACVSPVQRKLVMKKVVFVFILCDDVCIKMNFYLTANYVSRVGYETVKKYYVHMRERGEREGKNE
jgi:hypothetical protein